MYKSTTNTSIPNSTLFVIDNSRETYCLYPSVLVSKLVDLRYNFREKLEIANKIVHTQKVNISGLFSERDVNIINQIVNYIKAKTPITDFLKSIASSNIIKYREQPNKHITEVLRIPYLQEIDKTQTYNRFYKWVGLDNYTAEKIRTIINGQIYMARPIEFNDRFDCQLHFHRLELLEMAENDEEKMSQLEFFKLMTSDFIMASSFSFNNPKSADSLNMWGLYGGKGNGIALSYELDDLILMIIENIYKKNQSRVIMFDRVQYDDDYNPGKLFTKCAKKYFYENDHSSIEEFWRIFSTTKSKTWEHEQELRFFRNAFYELSPLVEETIKRQDITNVNKLLACQELIRAPNLEHNIKFIPLKEIILGWSVSVSGDIDKLINFANNHSPQIPVVKLDKYINYKTNEFWLS